jgi:hypothetical protein
VSGSRQNIYTRGTYEGDFRVEGDNGLSRAVAGRTAHRRAVLGQCFQLADPSILGNGAALGLIVGAHTLQSPLVVNCPQAEQLTLQAIYDGSAADNSPSFVALRFLLVTEFVTGWLQPAPLRGYNLHTVAAGLLSSNYAAPVVGIWTFPFDQIYLALLPGATLNMNVQGMYSTGAARYSVVASQNT